MRQAFIYQFEWDPAKAHANIKKHGISFERSATVFKDRRALSIYDNEHSRNEDRWITLGLDRNGALLIVCHTFRKGAERRVSIRIISSRKATKKEIKKYEEL